MSRSDAVTAGATIALLAGAADTWIVLADAGLARRGIAFVPLTMFPVAALVAALLCGVAMLPFLWSVRTRTMSIAAAILAGPLLVVFLRSLYWKRVLWPGLSRELYALLAAAVMISIAFGVAMLVRRIRFPRWLRPVPFVMLAACLVVLLVEPRQWNAGTSQERAPRGRNVILVFLDTVRYDAARTRFGAEGVTFANALTPSPWTIPSHLSMVSGIPANRLLVDFEYPYLRHTDTLAMRFRRRGYRTSAVVANYLLTPGTGFADGFETYQYPSRCLDYARTAVGSFARDYGLPTSRVCEWLAPAIVDRAHASIRDAKGPFFIAVNFLDAHDPYPIPAPCRATTDNVVPSLLGAMSDANINGKPLPQSDNDRLRRRYEEAVNCLGRSVERLLAPFEESIRRGDTVVAMVGDHGEQFGEHAFYLHGNSLYRQTLHVPFIVRGAGLTTRRLTAPVSTAALHDLVLRLATASPGEADGIVDRVVQRYPAIARYDPPPGAPRRLGTPLLALQQDGFYLIDAGTRAELYDLRGDPDLLHDVSAQPGTRATLLSLQSKLRALEQERPKRIPRDDAFSGLGYLR
jgi:arylsulfatase A-like enzyme